MRNSHTRSALRPCITFLHSTNTHTVKRVDRSFSVALQQARLGKGAFLLCPLCMRPQTDQGLCRHVYKSESLVHNPLALAHHDDDDTQGCRRRSWRRACARSLRSSTTTRYGVLSLNSRLDCFGGGEIVLVPPTGLCYPIDANLQPPCNHNHAPPPPHTGGKSHPQPEHHQQVGPGPGCALASWKEVRMNSECGSGGVCGRYWCGWM